MAQAPTRTRHALEPLSVEEIETAVAILRAERGVDERYRFVQIALHEPPKADVLAAEQNGSEDALEREAHAILIDRAERTTIEATVSLSAGRIISWERVDVGQP